MNITENQIKEKKIAGISHSGPVVYIQTIGGLHAFFKKEHDGSISTLAAAPHIAIATFFAEKKDPTINWNSDFMCKSENTENNLIKTDADQYEKYRNMFWSQSKGIKKSEASELYFVYQLQTKGIWISSIDEIKNDLAKNEIDSNCLVRPIDLSQPPKIIELCDEFKKPYVDEN